MAKAHREPTPITLTLSEEEAATLVAILRKIAGAPDTSPRQHADSVCEALYDVLPDSAWEHASGLVYSSGGIAFRDYP